MLNSVSAKYHIIAILTVGVWGTTFISTKILINCGLTPQEIFILRFVIAYIGILFISPRRVFSDNVKDELMMIAAGLTGGTLYFFTENTALEFTQTTNVAFIICATPLLTAGLSLLINKGDKVNRKWVLGSAIALVGVAMLIFNGSVILKLSPIGDLLTLAAALSWAFYSLIINKLSRKYNAVFITRKVFFYGAVGILPVFAVHPFSFPMEGFLRPEVWGNLLFLGLLASLVCFAVWNVVLVRLGTIMSSNYLYLNPLFTTIAASLILDETLTIYAIAGVSLVMLGVFLATRK